MPGDWSTGGPSTPPAPPSLCAPLTPTLFLLDTAGHVGAPLPCSMVKLVDIPEMNYYAKDGEGEASDFRNAASLRSRPRCRLTLCVPILSDLHARAQCVQGIPEGPREDRRGPGRRRLAAQWRRRTVASCEITLHHTTSPSPGLQLKWYSCWIDAASAGWRRRPLPVCTCKPRANCSAVS